MRIGAGIASGVDHFSHVAEGMHMALGGGSRSNCVTAYSEFESLHTEAKEIFFGALKACDIASSLDRRIRFEGDLLHRLTADGDRSSTIDLSSFREIFVVALGKAAGPMLDALLDRSTIAAILLFRVDHGQTRSYPLRNHSNH